MQAGPSPFAKLLASTPDLRQVPPAQARIVIAMRVAVMAHAKKCDVRQYVARHIGNPAAAKHFSHVMEMMGDCWPEPIMVHRPCCQATSYDEMLLLDLITAVVQKQPEHFHGLLCDMIPQHASERLHEQISKFVTCFGRPESA
ncbi:MAG: hypothetical protein AAGE37_07410 [Pseudomonadota bacterium]